MRCSVCWQGVVNTWTSVGSPLDLVIGKLPSKAAQSYVGSLGACGGCQEGESCQKTRDWIDLRLSPAKGRMEVREGQPYWEHTETTAQVFLTTVLQFDNTPLSIFVLIFTYKTILSFSLCVLFNSFLSSSCAHSIVKKREQYFLSLSLLLNK